MATEIFSVRPTITAGDANLLPISDSIRKKGDAAVMLSKAVDNARLSRRKCPQVEPIAWCNVRDAITGGRDHRKISAMGPSQRMTILDRAPLTPALVIDPDSACIMPLARHDRRAGMGAVPHVENIAWPHVDDAMLLFRNDWIRACACRQEEKDQSRWPEP